jgi:hypothetical protein
MAGSMLAIGAATSSKGAMLAMVVELLVTAVIGAQFGFEASTFFEDAGNQPRIGQSFLIIDPSALDAGGRVVFGATVDLEEVETGDLVTYQIVGEDEADLKLGLINISSPIARALIGKEEGDTAVVMAPGGDKAYEVVAVRYI